jgi:hypothetical protein
MGGIGSTRWLAHRKKRTVEACLSLDISQLARQLGFSAGYQGSVTLTWVQPNTDEAFASCAADVDTATPAAADLTLRYQRPGEMRVRLQIRLVTTTPFYGGLQWWAVCPCGCDRRVRKLYLPPGEPSFGCRHCHDLTYRSCQQAHQYDRGTHAIVARMMGLEPTALRTMVQRWQAQRQRGRS